MFMYIGGLNYIYVKESFSTMSTVSGDGNRRRVAPEDGARWS